MLPPLDACRPGSPDLLGALRALADTLDDAAAGPLRAALEAPDLELLGVERRGEHELLVARPARLTAARGPAPDLELRLFPPLGATADAPPFLIGRTRLSRATIARTRPTPTDIPDAPIDAHAAGPHLFAAWLARWGCELPSAAQWDAAADLLDDTDDREWCRDTALFQGQLPPPEAAGLPLTLPGRHLATRGAHASHEARRPAGARLARWLSPMLDPATPAAARVDHALAALPSPTALATLARLADADARAHDVARDLATDPESPAELVATVVLHASPTLHHALARSLRAAPPDAPIRTQMRRRQRLVGRPYDADLVLPLRAFCLLLLLLAIPTTAALGLLAFLLRQLG